MHKSKYLSHKVRLAMNAKNIVQLISASMQSDSTSSETSASTPWSRVKKIHTRMSWNTLGQQKTY